MNTGHDGSMGTLHANSPREALSRIESMITMGGYSLPSRTIREMVVSSIDVIVQAARLRDGSRRITHITEVMGMEGDVIITQDLFIYDIIGEDAQGKLKGRHRSTGIGRPRFWDRARYYGEESRLAAALDVSEVADGRRTSTQQGSSHGQSDDRRRDGRAALGGWRSSSSARRFGAKKRQDARMQKSDAKARDGQEKIARREAGRREPEGHREAARAPARRPADAHRASRADDHDPAIPVDFGRGRRRLRRLRSTSPPGALFRRAVRLHRPGRHSESRARPVAQAAHQPVRHRIPERHRHHRARRQARDCRSATCIRIIATRRRTGARANSG